MSEQMITSWFQSGDAKFLNTFVYAKCCLVDHKKLWQAPEEVQVGDSLWLVMGDLNVIREDEERIGGNPRSLSAMEEFNSCIDHCGLLELGFIGSRMTWCNEHGG